MSKARCIVRGYADEPLDREALAYERKLIFIAKASPVNNGEHVGAIGFPEDHVFEYEPNLYDELSRAFSSKGPQLNSLWEKAKPLQVPLPLLERSR